MRSREEIKEQYAMLAGGYSKGGEQKGAEFLANNLFLEILIDIRDLLSEEKI